MFTVAMHYVYLVKGTHTHNSIYTSRAYVHSMPTIEKSGSKGKNVDKVMYASYTRVIVD